MTSETATRESNVLFLVWGGIGNMVMALPMIRAAALSLPEATFTILAQKRIMLDILEDDKHFKKLALDRPEFKGMNGKARLLREIRRMRPEAVISTVPSPKLRSGLLAALSGAGQRICAAQYGSILFNVRVSETSGERHYIHQNLRLLQPLGIRSAPVEYKIEIPAGNIKRITHFFANRNISQNSLIAGLHPGSGNSQKRWPVNNFIELGRQIIINGYKPMVFGGPEESDLVKAVADGIGPEALSFVGTKALKDTLAMIQRCNIFISNDSGLAHCAAALEIPTVVIFGPTDPDICRPIGSKVTIVSNHSNCGPCYNPSKGFRCRNNSLKCMDIPVINAIEAFKNLTDGDHEEM